MELSKLNAQTLQDLHDAEFTDDRISKMTAEEVFEAFCEYNGLINWARTLIRTLDNAREAEQSFLLHQFDASVVPDYEENPEMKLEQYDLEAEFISRMGARSSLVRIIGSKIDICRWIDEVYDPGELVENMGNIKLLEM